MLKRALGNMPRLEDPRVLVGYESADDAGVYLLDDGRALVQTVDFFTPVVDDPHIYGQIAAANALSDIFAMGAKPLFALSVLGFPEGILDEDILAAIFKGGAQKMAEAGVPIIGGHSVQDPEIKFGFCVTGTAEVAQLWTNSGARPGDDLYLTKPIGTGIITTGVKYGKTPDAVLEEATRWMLELNGAVGESLKGRAVHAATDVTGYGLVGHAFEVAMGSRVTLVIQPDRVPIIEGTEALARRGMLPRGIQTNRDYVADAVSWRDVTEFQQWVFLDPQTSGGLLLCLAPEEQDSLPPSLGKRLTRIGRVEPGGPAIRFEQA